MNSLLDLPSTTLATLEEDILIIRTRYSELAIGTLEDPSQSTNTENKRGRDVETTT